MTNDELARYTLIINLEEQLYFLDSSISNYSRHSEIKKFENKVMGHPVQIKLLSEIEAKRIATIVRVLVHDTNNSTSLLKHLCIKESHSFLDTAAPNDGKLHSMTNMIGVRATNSNQYLGLVAKINTGDTLIATPLYMQHSKQWYDYPNLGFDFWWDKVVIDINGIRLTRKDLILSAANKDGGTHIDSKLPENYDTAKRTGLIVNIQGTETEFKRNIVFASIAQIGWELLNSIEVLQ